jgi:hypothetical protein
VSADDETLLDRVIGPDAILVAIGGVDLDPGLVGPVTIRHGRDDVDAQPTASTASFTIDADAVALPSIGDDVTIDLGADAVAYFTAPLSSIRRFAGRVTDLTAIPARGVHGRAFVRVVAVAPLAVLGRTIVGDTPWPSELDGVRADRVLDLAVAANPAIVVDSVDPGFYVVRARDVDRKAALGLLQELARDALGVLVGLRSGAIAYHDAEHRRNSPIRVTVDASEALADTAWVQDLAGLTNDVTVAYGDAEPQAETGVVDEVSVDTFGRYGVRLATQLDDEAGAAALASALVGRGSRPAWRIENLTVELLRTVDPVNAAILLDLEVSDLVAVTGFPTTGPFVTSSLWVEGWTETIARDEWTLVLNVSGFAYGGPPARWVDVDASVAWAEVPLDVSWLGFSSWDFPRESAGRWVDLASNLDWIDVPAQWADA